MLPKISKITELQENCSTAILFDNFDFFTVPFFSEAEIDYVKEKLTSDTDSTVFRYPMVLFFHKRTMGKELFEQMEVARKAGSKFFDVLKNEKIKSFQIVSYCENTITLSFLEGLLLSAYSFTKYKKEKDDYMPDEVFILDNKVSKTEIDELIILIESVFFTRDMVNEPLSYLTARKFSEEMEKLGNDAGFSVEVFNKKRIEALRMGGLLAVNRGSPDPPTFNIMEWKPEDAINEKPVVLVGKGIVFDTGGLNLKPTQKSMEYMKCDMAGGAVVSAVMFAVAKNKLPLYLVGLVPATDNRPDGNAYVPGDIIKMYDGSTVEIKNTDAEGRLLLADALSYAKNYNPKLVIDVATLTGSAEIIAGPHAVVAMGNTGDNLNDMKLAGEAIYERIVEVPLWEEFAKSLKSSVADINNIGSREGQTSIAGKFLEHFTDYLWIHLDIAGVAFFQQNDFYRPAGGTGVGTRLLYHFLKRIN